MKDQDQYITPEDAAEFLRVSKPTVHRWINEGKLDAWKVGTAWNSRVWVYRKSVIKFIKEVQGRDLPPGLK